jgi:hypothetical protein
MDLVVEELSIFIEYCPEGEITSSCGIIYCGEGLSPTEMEELDVDFLESREWYWHENENCWNKQL